MSRDFVDRVTEDTRRYTQELLQENQRLRELAAELETDRDRLRVELDQRAAREQSLKERLAEADRAGSGFREQYQAVEQQHTDLANLYVASYQLHGTVDRESVLASLLEIVINLVGSEELVIVERDLESNELRAVAWFGVDPASLDFNGGVIGNCLATGERFLGQADDAMTACIPLKLDDRVFGAIAIFGLLDHKSGLQPVDFELFDLLATHAATALFATSAYARHRERTGA